MTTIFILQLVTRQLKKVIRKIDSQLVGKAMPKENYQGLQNRLQKNGIRSEYMNLEF